MKIKNLLKKVTALCLGLSMTFGAITGIANRSPKMITATDATFGSDWNALFGTSYTGTISSLKVNSLTLNGTSGDISIEVKNGSSTNGYVKTSDFRCYNGYTVTITASSGFSLKSIISTKGGKTFKEGISSDVGKTTINDGALNWSGESASVKFSISGTVSFATISCTYDVVHTHDSPLTETAAQSANCTTSGHSAYYYCSGCKKYYSDSSASSEIGDSSALATWLSSGGGGYIKPLEHNFVHHDKVAAQVGVDGMDEYYSCNRCDAVFDKDYTQTEVSDLIIPALTHEHIHDWSSSWTKDETGHWHICNGGDDCAEVKDFSTHNYGDWVIDCYPSFDNTGLKHKTCSDCGYEYLEEIDQLTHNFDTSNWSHDSNSHWHACTDVSYEYLKSDEEAHNFVKDSENSTEATYSTTGIDHMVCSVCGESKNVVTPVLDAFKLFNDFSSYNKDTNASFTNGDFTVTFGNGENTSNYPSYVGESGSNDKNTLRIYIKNTIQITSSDKSISKIEIVWQKRTDKTFCGFTASIGTYDDNTPTTMANGDQWTATWTGSTKNVTFTAGSASGTQAIISSIKVYFDTTIKTLKSIALSGEYQTEFGINETFNHDGVVVTANYEENNVESRVLTTDDIVTYSTPDTSTKGEKTVTVSFTENGVTKTVDYSIVVKDKLSTPSELSYDKTTNTLSWIGDNEASSYTILFDEETEIKNINNTSFVLTDYVNIASHLYKAQVKAISGNDYTYDSNYSSVFEFRAADKPLEDGTYELNIDGDDFLSTSYSSNDGTKYFEVTSSDTNKTGSVNVTVKDVYHNGGIQMKGSTGKLTFETNLGTITSVTISNKNKTGIYSISDNKLSIYGADSKYCVLNSITIKFIIGSVATYKWVDTDNTSVLKEVTQLASNPAPTFDGTLPTKADDTDNTYVFKGWTSSNEEGVVTYTPEFIAVPKIYESISHAISNKVEGKIVVNNAEVQGVADDGAVSSAVTFVAEEGKVITAADIVLKNESAFTISYSNNYGVTWDYDPTAKATPSSIKKNITPKATLPEDLGETNAIKFTLNDSSAPDVLLGLNVETKDAPKAVTLTIAKDLGFTYVGTGAASTIDKGQLKFSVDANSYTGATSCGYLVSLNTSAELVKGNDGVYDFAGGTLNLNVTNLSKEVKVMFYAVIDGVTYYSDAVVTSFKAQVEAGWQITDSMDIVGNSSDAQIALQNYINSLSKN